jgi:hypothetical protein
MIGFIGISVTITVNYNSSHIELLHNDVCLTGLSEESLTSLNVQINSLLYLPRGPNISHHVTQLIALCYSVCFHGNLVFSNLLPGKDSMIAICCSRNVISEPLLSNGRPLWIPYSSF